MKISFDYRKENDTFISNRKEVSVYKAIAINKCFAPRKVVSPPSYNCLEEKSIPSFESLVKKNKKDIYLNTSFPFNLNILTNDFSHCAFNNRKRNRRKTLD